MAIGSPITKGILPTLLRRAKTVTATNKEVKGAEAKIRLLLPMLYLILRY